MDRKLPQIITFQWYITDQCNFRCKHCYQESFDHKGLPFSELIKILDKLAYFVINCRKENNTIRAHINFTGGEPFLRKDFIKLIARTAETRQFSFGILSNGTLPSDEELNKLKKLNLRFVQISLEGSKETNDEIRGEGSYKKIIRALRTYKQFGIPFMISFTANSKNYKEFPQVVKIARKYGAYKIWTDRYLPFGGVDELMLNTDQTKELLESITREQKRNNYFLLSKTIIASDRALQFLTSGGQPYRCSAGNTLLAILPNGDILPCRRLPIKIGNLKDDDLVNLYKSNSILKSIQDPNKVDNDCANCHYKASCGGGLKCLSYAVSKDFNKKDINCWI